MIQFLLFGGLATLAIALLVAPLLGRPRAQAARAAYDLEVYRDQLRELDLDRARDLITAEQHESARREIERRILALDLGPASWAGAGAPGLRLVVAAAVAIGVPLLGGAVYLGLGSPSLPDRPLAARAGPGGAPAEDIAVLVERLAERLRSEPDDLEGWTLLARSYSSLGRYPEAVAAMREVVRLTDRSPGALAMLAEHMVFAADGMVTPESRSLFEEARAADPGDPASAFYLGLAEEQAGDARGALDLWTGLGRASAPDAPWLPDLRDRIAAAAESLGLDATVALAGIPEPAVRAVAEPGPTEEDMAAAAAMSAEDQQAMIRSMVEGLAERLESEPDDLAGWRRLGRAYGVLGESAKARDAWARAAALAPDDPAVLAAYGEAIVVAAPTGPIPESARLVFRRLLDLDGANPSALWYLGRVAAEGGKPDEARDLWRRLVALLPEGSPERAEVEKALASLGSG